MTPRQSIDRFWPGLVLLLAIIGVGTAGYYMLEGIDPLQSFFTSILVISTLGLVRPPATTGGLLLTVVLIITGVGTLSYLISQLAEVVIESSLGNREERKMQRQIAALRRHCIICGYGRVGRHAAAEFAAEKRPFVVIDFDRDAVDRARADGCTAIPGDATEDHVLKAAGIERAAALLITTASDAANVFITLTARAFNPKLIVITRASEDSSEAKMEKAGADYVIAPETIGGKRMASLAMRPDVTGVVDTLAGSTEDEAWLDQTTVQRGSSLAGRRIGEVDVFNETGATIIAIRRQDGRTILNPGSDEYIREGDVLISVARRGEVAQIEEMSQGEQEEEAHP